MKCNQLKLEQQWIETNILWWCKEQNKDLFLSNAKKWISLHQKYIFNLKTITEIPQTCVLHQDV